MKKIKIYFREKEFDSQFSKDEDMNDSIPNFDKDIATYIDANFIETYWDSYSEWNGRILTLQLTLDKEVTEEDVKKVETSLNQNEVEFEKVILEE